MGGGYSTNKLLFLLLTISLFLILILNLYFYFFKSSPEFSPAKTSSLQDANEKLAQEIAQLQMQKSSALVNSQFSDNCRNIRNISPEIGSDNIKVINNIATYTYDGILKSYDKVSQNNCEYVKLTLNPYKQSTISVTIEIPTGLNAKNYKGGISPLIYRNITTQRIVLSVDYQKTDNSKNYLLTAWKPIRFYTN